MHKLQSHFTYNVKENDYHTVVILGHSNDSMNDRVYNLKMILKGLDLILQHPEI